MEDALGGLIVDPDKKREQDIMAEVARRRAALNNAEATKRKSDAIFDRFDVDKDGYMNYEDIRLVWQQAATCQRWPTWRCAKKLVPIQQIL